MRKLLNQIGLPTAIGVCISERDLTLVQLTLTPFGVRESGTQTISLDSGKLKSSLNELLTNAIGRTRRDRVPVAIGVPTNSVYLQTRPINSTVKDPSPQVLLRESMHGAPFPVDRMVVDVLRTQLKRRTVAGIAACNGEFVSSVLEAIKSLGLTQYRVEPNPCALMRRAQNLEPKSHGDAVVRICLGDQTGIAVLMFQNVPVVWRQFDVIRGDEATGILAAVRAIQTTAPHCGFDDKLDSVVIHGRSELQQLLDFDWLRTEIGIRTTWLESPTLNPESTAYGLALGAIEEEEVPHFDLLRKHKPVPTILQRFPWRTVIYQVLIILSMAFFLIGHYRRVHYDHLTIRAQNSLHPWLKNMQQPELAKRKQDADLRLSSVKRFLDSRVVWTNQINGVVGQLPDELTLSVLEGTASLPENSKKKVKAKKPTKSFSVRGQAPFTPAGSTPPAIGDFVRKLQASESIQKEFPLIELTGLVRSTTRDLDEPVTAFTVELSPKPNKGATK